MGTTIRMPAKIIYPIDWMREQMRAIGRDTLRYDFALGEKILEIAHAPERWDCEWVAKFIQRHRPEVGHHFGDIPF